MQVEDDFSLLQLMLGENKKSDVLYQATNFWDRYEKMLVPELKRRGLKDFKRRRFSKLSSFRALDWNEMYRIDLTLQGFFNNSITKKYIFVNNTIERLNLLLNRLLPIKFPIENDLFQLSFQFARDLGEKSSARKITDFEESLVGNPEKIIRCGDKNYTMAILNYYLEYVFCSGFINFDDIKLYVELGSGAGKQVEVIKKLHPNIAFLLFDIPPQLYVCEQYLKAVFPGDVISYRDTYRLEQLDDIQPGKIYILGNHKFPLIEKLLVDLFWNSASMQEMEPPVVENYLRFVNPAAQNIFLRAAMGGMEVARKPGMPGVIEKTRLEHYQGGLSNFEMVGMKPQYLPISAQHFYSNSFWKKRAD